MSNIDFSTLLKIQKPGRYFGNEINAASKSFFKSKVNFALCYPDSYEIGMSNTGIILLYRLLNSLEGINCDRVFSPFPDFEEYLNKKKIELFSLESKQPISKFDAVGFGYQYETAATNILNILKLSGIPLKRSDRKEEDPVIICGGPCAVNPISLSEFVDVFVIGDGEEVILKIAEIFVDFKKRQDRIYEISKLESAYCPSIHNPEKDVIKRAVVYDYSKYLDYYEPFITNMDIIQNRVNLEIMRGCMRGCRFCLAGYINRPARVINPDKIKNSALKLLTATGINSLTLASLSSSDYPEIDCLLKDIMPEFDKNKIIVSVPSLRADTLSRLISYNLNETKKSSITIAPEAGSLRLRKKINKNLTDEDIEFALKLAVDRGYQTIKLYFMIGLPDETMEDLDGIAAIAKSLLFYGKRKIKRVRVSLSVFTPKPHTPLQWSAYSEYQEFNEKIKYLCSKLKYDKIELIWHSYYSGLVESIIARGGKTSNDIILNAFNNGAKMDNWTEYFKFEYWDNAVKLAGLDYRDLIKPIDINSILPWNFVDIGVKKSFLKDEYQKFLGGEQTEDCRISGCNGCSDSMNCRPQDKIEIKKTSGCGDSGLNEPDISPELEPKICQPFLLDREKNIAGPDAKFVYRMIYIKTYKLKFISHLDLQKLMITAFKFAGLKMKFSQGFNKKPLIEFSGALSLGFVSLNEIIDITLDCETDCEILKTKLNEFFKKNIVFKNIFRMENKKKSISESTNEILYKIVLYKSSGISREKLENIIGSKIEIQKKDKVKIVDLKTMVSGYSLMQKSEFDIASLKIKSCPQGSVNPYQIIKKIVAPDSIRDIIKTDCFAESYIPRN